MGWSIEVRDVPARSVGKRLREARDKAGAFRAGKALPNPEGGTIEPDVAGARDNRIACDVGITAALAIVDALGTGTYRLVEVEGHRGAPDELADNVTVRVVR